MDDPDPGLDLLLVLERGRDRGLLGPGPIDVHRRQAGAFAAVVGDGFDGQGLDLGSGGGVPGLLLATRLTQARWCLVDASLRRVRFLQDAVRELRLAERVTVVHERAEVLGRDEAWRSAVDLVVARGFGPPAVVAECAAPLLRVGGRLVVSEPPEADDLRWPEDGLEPIGMGVLSVGERESFRLAELVQHRSCPARFPRRVGVPERSPLF